ncbi:methylated-DNA--[protein]-cysteine S-methyltransferase [Chachezhania sediminis]|uniref:methylated-DNA--[protein]-cysteine S-methyltransferase n=1 Tax=Chachezhania sediminis TaxID=2599291 RepID=UPI00131BC725|nr:methylated-DNA--[protein]-cysteine S-methyltransferase [Chachezhania sediminis]
MPSVAVDTRFGTLCVTEDDGAIVRLTWADDTHDAATALLREAVAQIRAYEAGELKVFDLPLAVRGNDFQKAVCAQMSAIPFGETRTYGDIAKALGHPAQAVGQACGRNPIAVVIPCHRVMGARGLTGFSGGEGVETKVQLLIHEKAGGFLI